MPKMKSNRAAAKRFKVSGSGRIKRRRAYRNHILTKKGPKRLRHLRDMPEVSKNDESAVVRLLKGIISGRYRSRRRAVTPAKSDEKA